jgi:hypothetical protein
MEGAEFVQLQAGVGYGVAPTAAWQPIATCPLLILVGVTGVGKSTTLDALRRAGLPYRLLPDRRELTDRLMIPAMQRLAGEPVEPVSDRGRRFAYTRAYRQHHPGGMGEALSQLWVEGAPGVWLFDGLRGDNEVSWAALRLPQACFVLLDAPDVVRVVRLMGRQDPFDQLTANSAASASGGQQWADWADPEAGLLFSAAEGAYLAALVERGEVTAAELRRALAIVVEERRNYDPQATRASLAAQAPLRSLRVDTVQAAPDAVAAQIVNFLQRRWTVQPEVAGTIHPADKEV